MSRSKDAWLSGPGDLAEKVIEDVPAPGESVKIRALSATAANVAASESVSTYEERGQTKMRVDNVLLDIIRFRDGVVDPRFTTEEVRAISAKFGPTFQKVVNEIVELSGIDREAVADLDARFPSSEPSPSGTNGDGAPGGDAGPDVPERVGAGTGDDGN